MQRMQRLTGRFMPRTPNEADIESMLCDFKDAETMLTKVCVLLFRSMQGGRLEVWENMWGRKDGQTCNLPPRRSAQLHMPQY